MERKFNKPFKTVILPASFKGNSEKRISMKNVKDLGLLTYTYCSLYDVIDSSQTTQFTHSALTSSQHPWVRDEIRPTLTFLNQLYSNPAGSKHQR